VQRGNINNQTNNMKQKTNEQLFKSLLKEIDPMSMALLRERIVVICEHTAENFEGNGFISKDAYVRLNEIVQKHIGFNNN
jgi:hypothetical protein